MAVGDWWRFPVGGWWSLGAVLKGGPQQRTPLAGEASREGPCLGGHCMRLRARRRRGLRAWDPRVAGTWPCGRTHDRTDPHCPGASNAGHVPPFASRGTGAVWRRLRALQPPDVPRHRRGGRGTPRGTMRATPPRARGAPERARTCASHARPPPAERSGKRGRHRRDGAAGHATAHQRSAAGLDPHVAGLGGGGGGGGGPRHLIARCKSTVAPPPPPLPPFGRCWFWGESCHIPRRYPRRRLRVSEGGGGGY